MCLPCDFPKIVTKVAKPAKAKPSTIAIEMPIKLNPKYKRPIFSPSSAAEIHKISIPRAAAKVFLKYDGKFLSLVVTCNSLIRRIFQ